MNIFRNSKEKNELKSKLDETFSKLEESLTEKIEMTEKISNLQSKIQELTALNDELKNKLKSQLENNKQVIDAVSSEKAVEILAQVGCTPIEENIDEKINSTIEEKLNNLTGKELLDFYNKNRKEILSLSR